MKNKRWSNFPIMNATQGSEIHLYQIEHPAACPPRTVFPVNPRAWFGVVVSTPRANFRKTAHNLIQFCRLAALLLALPGVAQAQFTFNTNADNTITITGYTGSNGEVRVPGSIAGRPVTSIGDFAFYATDVTNVLIPDTVTNIGDGAFFDCQSLTNVTLGSRVVSLGDWAFGFCPRLTSVDCRGNVPSLGGCNVFYGNAAAVHYLPGATGWGALLADHPAVLWNSQPVPFSYTTNSDSVSLTITGYTGNNDMVTIPGSINFPPVSIIGNYAFNNTGLTSITIPSGVTTIGSSAFSDCSGLTSITIPSGVTTIGSGAFSSCSDLTNITVTSNNPAYSSIGGVLFDVNQATLIQFPGGLGGSYSTPNRVTTIGSGAFAFSGLTSVSLPNSVTAIGSEAFAYCYGLTSVEIPNSVTNTGSAAFWNCIGLTNIVIPNSVTTIGSGAFSDCSGLTSVTIPNSVTSIEGGAFAYCYGLTSVTIPNSVASIGSGAFMMCFSLKSIYFTGNAPSLGSFVFSFVNGNAAVYFLPGTTGWTNTVGSPFFSGPFNGLPTVLWNPQARTGDGSFGVRTNQFGFNITGSSNLVVVVEACTNLFNPDWQPVQTNTLTTGSSYFSDSQWTNYPGRFYRLRSP